MLVYYKMELTDNNIEKFRQDVEYFARINKDIEEVKLMMKPLKEKLRILTDEKTELEQQLCKIMDKNNLDRAELPDNKGIIEYKTRTAVVPVKKDDIRDKLIIFFKEVELSKFNKMTVEEKGNEIFNFIYSKENRETVVKETLKSKLG